MLYRKETVENSDVLTFSNVVDEKYDIILRTDFKTQGELVLVRVCVCFRLLLMNNSFRRFDSNNIYMCTCRINNTVTVFKHITFYIF